MYESGTAGSVQMLFRPVSARGNRVAPGMETGKDTASGPAMSYRSALRRYDFSRSLGGTVHADKHRSLRGSDKMEPRYSHAAVGAGWERGGPRTIGIPQTLHVVEARP